MRLLDFFCYFWYRWYEDRKMSKSNFFSDEDNAINALTIQFTLSQMLLAGIYIGIVSPDSGFESFKYPMIIVAVLFYFLTRYIYIAKGRLERLKENKVLMFNVSDKVGRLLPGIISLITLILFSIVAIVHFKYN